MHLYERKCVFIIVFCQCVYQLISHTHTKAAPSAPCVQAHPRKPNLTQTRPALNCPAVENIHIRVLPRVEWWCSYLISGCRTHIQCRFGLVWLGRHLSRRLPEMMLRMPARLRSGAQRVFPQQSHCITEHIVTNGTKQLCARKQMSWYYFTLY